MSFTLASNLETQQRVWITVKDGIPVELDPIKVCAQYRDKYSHEIKQVTVR
jgi:hypothetical protein